MSKLSFWKTICLVCVFCAVEVVGAPAQTFTTLASFNGTNGANPGWGSLVQGLDGNFYGTTFNGGAYGDGTVFKITPEGKLTTLHSFDGTDGAVPLEGLVLATNGNFYGTTSAGGAYGEGTVFEITPAGKFTTLHSFDGSDGCTPYAGLVQAVGGNLYGATSFCGGTLFRITPGGALTTLYSFGGIGPNYPPIQASNGNFYGETYYGGTYGDGMVFEFNAAGELTTLHNFDGSDGAGLCGLGLATDGKLYGATFYGGANSTCSTGFGPGCGTVFKMTSGGALIWVYSFCAQTGCTDGDGPATVLAQATNGDLYGTTTSGGAYNASGCGWDGDVGCGTVFEITPEGKLKTLYSFCAQTGCADGNDPIAGLVQATNGKLYGTTHYGGASGDGTIFSLDVGLGPFVKTLPTSGKVGAAVKILGNNLTGSTGVTFNGTAATFTVVSKSLITTTVPSGATTGKVQVTTPSGTLTSNANFRVP